MATMVRLAFLRTWAQCPFFTLENTTPQWQYSPPKWLFVSHSRTMHKAKFYKPLYYFSLEIRLSKFVSEVRHIMPIFFPFFCTLCSHSINKARIMQTTLLRFVPFRENRLKGHTKLTCHLLKLNKKINSSNMYLFP